MTHGQSTQVGWPDNPPVRIVIVQPWIRVGGAELLSIQLSAALEAGGDEAPIVALFVDRQGLPDIAASRTYILPPPPLSALFLRSRPLTFLAGPFVLLWLVLWAGRRADVLNPHNLPAPLVAAIAGPLLRKPVVWTCNEVPEPLPADQAVRLGLLESAMWRVGARLSRVAAAVPREILVLSEKTGRDVRTRYAREATVIRPGVEVEAFAGAHESRHDPLALLFVAKLHPQKDPLLAVRTLAEIRRRGIDATLTIVGRGPLRPAIDELAASLSVAPFLRVEPALDADELVERYRASDVLLVTAGGHQSWGLTPFEALAAGTPSVISSEVGAAEILGPAAAALVVARTPSAFAEAAIRLHNDALLATRLVENGRSINSVMTWRKYASATRRSLADAMSRDRDRARPDWFAWTITALALTAYAAQLLFFFGRFPLPWPDETLYAEPALQLLRHGTLASPMFEGPSLGAAQHAYWLLPGYFLLVAAAFLISGPGLEAIRQVSVIAGLATLALTASLVLRLGGGRRAAAIAIALLSLDPLFVRASLVGRTDLPALALVLLALRLGLARGVRTEVAAGFVAASAALIHPLGGAALLVLAARPLLRIPSRTPYAAIGAAVPLLAAGLFVLQDPASFAQQLALQLDRKGTHTAWDLRLALRVVVDQYGGGALGLAPVLAWFAGGVALLAHARHVPAGRMLLLGFALEVVAINLSAEMWYPVYVVPFAYAGVALSVGRRTLRSGRGEPSSMRRWIRAVATTAVLLSCALLAADDAQALAYRWRATASVSQDSYLRWSSEVARAIPTGARVLVGGAPDPAWVLLLDRPDVQLHGILNTPAAYRYYAAHPETYDYAVVSGVVDPEWIDLFGRRATTVADVTGAAGSTGGSCPDGWTPCRRLEARVYGFLPGR